MRRDRIGQPAGLINAGKRCQYFIGHLLADIHVLFEVVYGLANCCISIGIIEVFTLDLPHCSHRKGFTRIDSLNNRALTTLDKHLNRAIRQFEKLKNCGDCTYLVQVVHIGIIVRGVALSDQQYLLITRHGMFQRFNRALAADE